MAAATPPRPTGPLLFLVAGPADAPAAAQLGQALEARGFRAWAQPLADPVTDTLDPHSMAALQAADRVVVLASAATAADDRAQKALIVAAQLGKPLIALRWIDTPAPPPPLFAGAAWLGPADSPEAAAAQVAALLQPPLPRVVAGSIGAPPRRRSGAGRALALGGVGIVAVAGVAAVALTLGTGGTPPANRQAEAPQKVPDIAPLNVAAPVQADPVSVPPVAVQEPGREIIAAPDEPYRAGEQPPPAAAETPSQAPPDRRAAVAPTPAPVTAEARPLTRPAAPVRSVERAYSPRRDGAVPPATRPAATTPNRTPAPGRREPRAGSQTPPGFGPPPQDRRGQRRRQDFDYFRASDDGRGD